MPTDLLASAALAMSVRPAIAEALLQGVASTTLTFERAAEVVVRLGADVMSDEPRFRALAMIAVGATAGHLGDGHVEVDTEALRSMIGGYSPSSDRGLLLAAHMEQPSTCEEIESLRQQLLLAEERSALLAGLPSVEWKELMLGGRVASGEYVAKRGDFELSAFQQKGSPQWAWAVTHALEMPRTEEGVVDGGREEAQAAAIAAMMRWSVQHIR